MSNATKLFHCSEEVVRFKRANLQLLLDGLYEKDRAFMWRIHSSAPWKATTVEGIPAKELDASIDLCYRTYQSRDMIPPSLLEDAPAAPPRPTGHHISAMGIAVLAKALFDLVPDSEARGSIMERMSSVMATDDLGHLRQMGGLPPLPLDSALLRGSGVAPGDVGEPL